MVCECCVVHRAIVRSASQLKSQTRKQSLLFLVETRGMSGWSSDTRLRKFGLVQIGRPPLVQAEFSHTSCPQARWKYSAWRHCLVARVWRFGSGRATLCVPTWWLKVNIGTACPRVWRLGSGRATLCVPCPCWLRYGYPRFGELGFDRPTLCNLVRKRETLHVPTLSDDLVLKTMIDRITLYQFICCLSVGA